MSKRSCFSPLDIQIDCDVQATYENIEIVAGISDSVDAVGSNIQKVIEVTTDPLKTSILNAKTNAANAQTSADNALASEQNAKNSEIHTVNLEQTVVEKEALVSHHYNSIDTVATNITNVNTVSTNITDINTVSATIANVNTVSINIEDINNVANDLTNIDKAIASANEINGLLGVDLGTASINSNGELLISQISVNSTPSISNDGFLTVTYV